MLAAILWSSSGAFVKTLQLPDVTLAVYRAGFAGLSLLIIALATRVKFSFDWRMLGMTASFALMNYWYMASMTRTTAANAIFLQYSAPAWMYLVSVYMLREPQAPRTKPALLIAMAGLAVLIGGEWVRMGTINNGIILGLMSGAGFAAVALFIRLLRSHDPLWLATLNMLAGSGAAALVFLQSPDPAVRAAVWPPPSGTPLLVLIVFGFTQLGLPYVLFGWGLKHVPAPEAGLLALFEPVLMPVWAYLFAGEIPAASTIVGGAILIAALVWQEWPRKTESADQPLR
jgi:DME family drug/metabolite transporter